LNKLPIASTLRNCFSESPWKGSGRHVEYQTPLTPPFNATGLMKPERTYEACNNLGAQELFGLF